MAGQDWQMFFRFYPSVKLSSTDFGFEPKFMFYFQERVRTTGETVKDVSLTC